MRKATTRKSFGRSWLAASLVFTFAAFGCTTNQYESNGQPAMSTPAYNSVIHSTTPGSSSGTQGVGPMASSFTYLTPRVDVDAIANLAAEQGYRGRILGSVNPGGVQPGVTVATGQYGSPAMIVNPQATVNSSISSQPTPVITGGDAGTGITIVPGIGMASAAAVPVGTTAVNVGTNVGTTAATTGVTSVTGATAATGALATTGGVATGMASTTLAGGTVISPVPTGALTAPVATGAIGVTVPTGVVTRTSTATTTRTSALRTTTATRDIPVVGGIRITTGASGGVLVTNVVNTAPTTKSK